MAVEVIPGFSATLTSLVNDEIQAVVQVRASENAQQDIAFQKAIASGMSYDDQVKYLTKELADEKTSPLSSSDRIDQLTTQLTTTQASARMSDYETLYKANLAQMGLGKMTAQQNLDFLNEQLASTSDPALRSEIQSNISDASAEVTAYNSAILKNDQDHAVTSKSVSVLQDAITETTSHMALMNSYGDTELASVDEAALANLNANLGAVQIGNALNDVSVKSLTKGLGATDKLSFLDGQIASADSTIPVTVSGQDYSSAQGYWSQLKASYLSGNNSTFATANNDFGVFSSFFNEQSKNITDQMNASIKTNGYVTSATIDSLQSQLTTLQSNPDLSAYAEQFKTLSDTVMGTAVQNLAQAVVDYAKGVTGSSGTMGAAFNNADITLSSLATKYGVNLDAYRLTNATNTTAFVNSPNTDQTVPDSKVADALPAVVAPTVTPTDTSPVIPPVTPAAPVAPGTPPVTPPTQTPPVVTPPISTVAAHTVASGDTLSSIAAANNTTISALLQANPDIKNPNVIGVGQQIKLPTAAAPTAPLPTPAPTTPASKPITAAPTPPVVTPPTPTLPVATPAKPPVATPTPAVPIVAPKAAPTPTPVVPTPKAPTPYTIASGDTLGAIAAKNGTTVNALMAANPTITNANVIRAGATISIPTK